MEHMKNTRLTTKQPYQRHSGGSATRQYPKTRSPTGGSETEPTATALALPRLVGPGLLGGRARVWQFGATAPANSEGAGRILATVMTVDLSIGVALKFPFVLADHLDGSL